VCIPVILVTFIQIITWQLFLKNNAFLQSAWWEILNFEQKSCQDGNESSVAGFHFSSTSTDQLPVTCKPTGLKNLANHGFKVSTIFHWYTVLPAAIFGFMCPHVLISVGLHTEKNWCLPHKQTDISWRSGCKDQLRSVHILTSYLRKKNFNTRLPVGFPTKTVYVLQRFRGFPNPRFPSRSLSF
jgi:hypothetical protein